MDKTCNHVCTNYIGKNFCSEDKKNSNIFTYNKNINFDRNIKDNTYLDKWNPCKPFNSPSFSNVGVL